MPKSGTRIVKPPFEINGITQPEQVICKASVEEGIQSL
jgi:hypothetical protein